MFGILLVLHIIISIGLVVSVLMQSSKGEGLAGAFGGGGLSGAVFGGRGAATFLSKTTTVLAIAFMVTCILLTFTGGGTTVINSRVSDEAQKAARNAPVTRTSIPQGDQSGTQPPTQQQPQPGNQ